jgi:hypothetical protein
MFDGIAIHSAAPMPPPTQPRQLFALLQISSASLSNKQNNIFFLDKY